MTLQARISALSRLGEKLLTNDERIAKAVLLSFHHNPWFTQENTFKALQAIATQFLDKEKLNSWASLYTIDNNATPKTIGLVPAGNIPLVGFHDWLCIFITGHKAMVKLSEKDKFLMPLITELLSEIEPSAAGQTVYAEQLKGMDAVIATGSDNTARYFEYYFGKYPNIIRKNRWSVAVLDGSESTDDLHSLGVDLFRYFGLGCRNVSRLYIPEGYNFDPMVEALDHYSGILEHDKYKNNYDYNFTLLLLNKIPHIPTTSMILTENETFASRIGCVHYTTYSDVAFVETHLQAFNEHIQCVVSKHPIQGFNVLPFGKTQSPELSDYADNVDTMQFLTTL